MVNSLERNYSGLVGDLSDFQNGIILSDLVDLTFYENQNFEL